MRLESEGANIANMVGRLRLRTKKMGGHDKHFCETGKMRVLWDSRRFL